MGGRFIRGEREEIIQTAEKENSSKGRSKMKSDYRKERAALLCRHHVRNCGIVVSCLLTAYVASTGIATAQQSLPIEQASRGEQPIFSQSGVATWYGGRHVGRKTASGEYF